MIPRQEPQIKEVIITEGRYFRLECSPGFELGGRTFDYLVFEYTDKPPERGYFAAHAPEWGDAWRLCRVAPAEDCSTGKPFPYCEDGSEYPKDAQIFGVLKYGYVDYEEHAKGARMNGP